MSAQHARQMARPIDLAARRDAHRALATLVPPTMDERAEREHAMATLERDMAREYRRVAWWLAISPVTAILLATELLQPSWGLALVYAAAMGGWFLW